MLGDNLPSQVGPLVKSLKFEQKKEMSERQVLNQTFQIILLLLSEVIIEYR